MSNTIQMDTNKYTILSEDNKQYDKEDEPSVDSIPGKNWIEESIKDQNENNARNHNEMREIEKEIADIKQENAS